MPQFHRNNFSLVISIVNVAVKVDIWTEHGGISGSWVWLMSSVIHTILAEHVNLGIVRSRNEATRAATASHVQQIPDSTAVSIK